ncbi:hypothetical protein [Streptomyces canus]|uniref:hypothetical protein n=1 Tax=Streptomyces canus TaxID=58343 RepID=UPI0032434DBB
MLRDDGTYRATPYIAPIDLHQLGAGYDHHVYFTHSYGDTDIDRAGQPAHDSPAGAGAARGQSVGAAGLS